MDEEPKIPFIGKGWSFPTAFSKGVGVEMVENNADIVSSLHVLLSTKLGERLMNPEFGCDLTSLLFEPMDIHSHREIKDQIGKMVLQFEPRITLENVDVNYIVPQGIVNIKLVYTIRLTNTRSNMVYPFYIGEGTQLDI